MHTNIKAIAFTIMDPYCSGISAIVSASDIEDLVDGMKRIHNNRVLKLRVLLLLLSRCGSEGGKTVFETDTMNIEITLSTIEIPC